MADVQPKRLKRDQILQVSYLYGSVVNYQPGETLGPRLLTDYELVLIIDGHVTYSCGGIDYAAPPGTVILARPGFHESYRWDPRSETRHAYFHFNLDAIPRDWPAPSHWPIVVADPNPVIPALFHYIVKCCASHPTWPAERPSRDVNRMIEAMITAMLGGLGEAPPGSHGRPQPVQRALQWMRQMIDESPGHPMGLPDIAAAANVSPKHLCRLFQQSLNCSPARASRLLRLQLALALLSRSNLSIKQIGVRCGFSSPFQFSHCFQQVFGQSPSQTRRQILSGQSLPVIPLPADLTPRVHW
jgi:AraC family transcriptional regulator